MLITHGESGRSGVGRTRNAVAPTSFAGRFEHRAWGVTAWRILPPTPVILGDTNGREVALAYQFAGQSRSGLPARGQWKCLSLSKIGNVALRGKPWHAGSSHTTAQHCVQQVDLDVNPASPYHPKHRL